MEQNKELISVIIPSYNYGAYLPECIDSVLNQTHKNIEIIIIDDGSTDNTKSIAEKYLKHYDNIQYYKQENRGIVKTRNRGIKLARGDYLIQLDSDDWIDKYYLEKTLKKALKENLDIVYTQVQVFGRVDFITSYPEFDLELLKHNNFIHATALIKKYIFNDRQYDNYLTDKGNEDWDLFLDACLDGAKAGLVGEPLLHYRKHDNLKSRQDTITGTFKELLIRHHILNKQNAKHPDKMWYFSPYINILRESIGLYQENSFLKRKI